MVEMKVKRGVNFRLGRERLERRAVKPISCSVKA